MEAFDSSSFRGKNYFENGTQNYLVFQPMYKYFKKISSAELISHGNLKDFLMNSSKLLLHIITVLLQH